MKGIIDSQSIQMAYVLDLHGQPLHEQISNILCTMFEEMQKEHACASTDKNQWKEHGPVWMRKEYWIELCDIWGAEKWNENSTKAKQNRAVHPEANVHMSGSVSFAMHKARLESYSRGIDERYRDDS
ncbi:hypothetical protein Taro_006642 [Colocasia esculenta]|uniref:Uncharacterized protein n=1 Tax=Colocasia esculenta TaxID=4460 RepID=A0A843U1D7_COLES|nr:hypothetical protein [Colocasia esculenta]